MTLTLLAIRTNIYTDIYNHIQTGTYAITSNNIHSSYYDKQLRKEGYPQIIITRILIAEDRLTFGANGKYEVPISVMIDIHHNSSANARTVTDEVHSKFRGTGRTVLKTAGFSNIKFEADDYEKIPWTQNKSSSIYHLNFTAVYRGSS